MGAIKRKRLILYSWSVTFFLVVYGSSFIVCWIFVRLFPQILGVMRNNFFGVHVFKKDIRLCFQVVWLSCFWVIWKECNLRIFSNKSPSHDQLLNNNIILHLWWWLKVHKRVLYVFLMNFLILFWYKKKDNNYWFFALLCLVY